MQRYLLAGAALFLCGSGCNEIAGIHESAGLLDAASAASSGDPGTSGAVGASGNPSTLPSGSGSSSGPAATDAGTTLHPWADWPMPNPLSAGLPTPQKYDAGAADVIYDMNTGLTWQEVPPPDSYVWDDARAYCGNLALAGGSWRLPSRIELVSLIDYTQAPATINPDAFPNTAQDYFWSGSLFANDASYAWAVTFNFSVSPVEYDPISTRYRVRCVRP